MFAFIDESGLPHPKDSTRRPVLLAACVNERSLRPFFGDIRRIKLETIGNPDWEIKASETVIAKTLFRNRTAKINCVDRLVESAVRFDVRVFAVIMEHPRTLPSDSAPLLPIHFRLLLDRINRHALRCRSRALAIFDDRPDEAVLAGRFYRTFSAESSVRPWGGIIEMPLFVDSRTTPGIQIADLLAGIVRKHYENLIVARPEFPELSRWVERLFGQIRKCTSNFTKAFGRPVPGFLEVPGEWLLPGQAAKDCF